MLFGSETMQRQRHGVAAVWGLVFLGVLLALLVVAIDLGMLWNAQAELRTVADAAALAAAHTWAEQLAPGQPESLPPPARELVFHQAARYVREHRGDGTLHLLPNPDNAADGDVVFGFYDAKTGFVPAGKTDLTSPWLNAVRVRVRRDRQHGNPAGLIFGPLFGWCLINVEACAVAVMERRIVGFQCTDGQPIPLMPIALLSDPTGQTPDAWESQLAEQGAFPGNVLVADENAPPTVIVRLAVTARSAVGDTLTTLTPAAFPAGLAPTTAANRGGTASPASGRTAVPWPTTDSACLLRIGVGTRTETVRQVLTGLLPADLSQPEWGGQFVIDPAVGYRAVAAWPDGLALEDGELSRLVTALAALQQRGEIRIWPLFTPFLNEPISADQFAGDGSSGHKPAVDMPGVARRSLLAHNPGEPAAVSVAIHGFVAARILRVELKSQQGDPAGSAYLEITLQPQLLATRTAIVAPAAETKWASGDAAVNPHLNQPNPYLVRIQLAE